MPQTTPARSCWRLGLMLALLLNVWAPASRLLAAEYGTGVYILGYQSSMAGYQPDPGFYLRNDFYIYGGTAKIAPFSGRVEVDLRNRFIADVVTAIYVTPWEVLGARYAAGIIWLPVANSFLRGTLAIHNRFLDLSARREGDYTGVGDLVLTPVSLGWHLGQFHVMAFGDVYIPVGSYNVNRRLNTGFNRWALEPCLSITWMQPERGQEVSLALGYTINFENPATNYTTGNEFHLEFFLGQHLARGFTVGLAGYIYEQVTGDSGPGARLGAFHGQSIALGPCLTYSGKIVGHGIDLNARYYNEVKVRNRFDGQSFFLTVSFAF